jgi:hypothetical protein
MPNMMKAGYTKSYRKELYSDVWKMPPLYQRVFFYLRQNAAWQPETFPTRKGYGIALNPGQLITSYSAIAEGVSWYEYGVKKIPNKKTIKDILKWLEGNSMVTAFSNRHGTLIMLTNWDIYNSIGSEEVTQSNQPEVTQEKRSLDTLKEGKEPLRNKEIKNNNKKRYLEFVFFTEDEYKKLVEKFGSGTKNWIERLNNYIGSKGKKYKSHYHTILAWDKKEQEEKPSIDYSEMQ